MDAALTWISDQFDGRRSMLVLALAGIVAFVIGSILLSGVIVAVVWVAYLVAGIVGILALVGSLVAVVAVFLINIWAEIQTV